jgi:hypothetical protein
MRNIVWHYFPRLSIFKFNRMKNKYILPAGNFKKLFFSISIFAFTGTVVIAQPTVTGTTPVRNSINAAVNTNVSVTFSQAMNAATASNTSIKISSLRSGTRTISGGGVFSGGGTNTITFNPTTDFFANDKVTVTSTINCANTSNSPMIWPNAVQFTTASASSAAAFPEIVDIRGSNTNNLTTSLAVGDFDNDGDLDDVYIEAATNKVVLLKNLGNNIFAAGISLPGGATGMTELKAIDIEGDGDLDLVGTYGVLGIYKFINNGSGVFTYSTQTLTGTTAYKDIEVADMNGDGFMDLVIGNSSGYIYCFLNNGTGTFTASSNVLGGGAFNRLTTGDFDGDGFIDVAVANSTSSNVTVRMNDGSGLLFGGATFPMTGGNGFYIKTGDLDNDGDLDLAVLIQPNKIQLLTNNGSATFTALPAITYSRYPTYAFTCFNLADMDGDNRVDIVSFATGPSQMDCLSLLMNHGGMSFSEFNYTHTDHSSITPVELEIGDFNNDGKQDVMCEGNPFVDYFPSYGVPDITSFTPDFGSIPTTVTIHGTNLESVAQVKFGANNTLADSFIILDDHTIVAVVDTGTTSGPVTVCTPGTCVTSASNFEVQFNVTSVNPYHFAPTINGSTNVTVNFNHRVSPHANTGTDILVYGSMTGIHSSPAAGDLTTGGGTTAVTINPYKDFTRGEKVTTIVKRTIVDSIGVPIEKPFISEFYTKPTVAAVANFAPLNALAYGSNPAKVAFADIDNDGDQDEFMALGTGNQLQYKRNLGNGTFGPVTTLSTYGGPSEILTVDFDNDGDIDVACGGTMFANNGAGVFTGTTVAGAYGDAGDIDGDGLVDMIYTSFDYIYISHNHGNLSFTTSHDFSMPSYVTDIQNPSLVDIDLDGDLDFVGTRLMSDTIYCYKNNGNGIFTYASKSARPLGGTAGLAVHIAIADFNGDGLPDIAAVQRTNDELEIFTGNGNGFSYNQSLVVIAPPTVTANYWVSYVNAGDFNGDGKIDIITADGTGSAITYIRNTTAGPVTFAAPVQIPLAVGCTPYAVKVVDVDNDGDLDFASCNQANNTSTIGFNNGTATIPNITSMSPTSGNVGTVVTLTGTNLSCVTTISVNGVNAPSFSIVSATQIDVTIPAGATTGPITVTCGTTTVSAPGIFYICPTGPVTPTFSISASQSFPVCANTIVNFSFTGTNLGNNPNYTWYKNGNPVAYTNVYSSLMVSGDAVYCVFTSTDGCLTTNTLTSNTINATTTLLPGPISSLTGSTTVCASNGTSFTASSSSNATSYVWSLPPGWGGSSTTGSITVTPDSLNGYVTVAGQNVCGTGKPQSVFCDVTGGSVSVSASASSPVVCQNSPTTLNATSTGSVTGSPFSWLKKFGGPSYDGGYPGIGLDGTGNIFEVASFRTGMLIDSLSLFSQMPTTVQDAVVMMKFSSDGIVQWAKEFHATNNCESRGMIFDKVNNVYYVTGNFGGTLTIGSFSLTGVGTSIFTAKFDAAGNCLWLVKGTSSTSSITTFEIQLDPSGNPIVNTYLRGSCQFGSIIVSGTTAGDVGIIKYNAATGSTLWIAKSTNGAGTLGQSSITVDNSGSVYVFGTFGSSITLGTNNYFASGSEDIYLAKFNSSGTFVWSKHYLSGGTSDENTNLGITYDGAGAIYMGGSYTTSISFGAVSLLTINPVSEFYLKMDLNGNEIWAVNGFESNGALILSPYWSDLHYQNGKLYAMQYFSTTVFLPWGSITVPPTHHYETMFIYMDTTGVPLNLISSNGAEEESGTQFCVGSAGEIYFTGGFYNTARFGNQQVISYGATDGFIGKALPMAASGSSVSYNWMPGNLSGASVSVSPSTTTTYTVTATGGCGSPTATVTVTVNPSPTVTATPASSSICTGSSTSITASGATTYTWMPGSLTGTTVTVSPATTTTYTVTGTSGGCTGTTTVTIIVNPLPSITHAPISPSVCPGGSVSVTANGASTYTWAPPTGLNTTSGATVISTPVTTTTYTITGTSAAGCINTQPVTVTVVPSPTVTATAGNSSICNGASTTLTGGGASAYSWMPGSLSGTTVTVSPASTTTYTVTGTSVAGCTNTATVTVIVNPAPTVSATAGNSSICIGGSTTLTGNGASTYTWMPGSLSGTTVTVTPTSTTTYTVTGTSVSGCTNTGFVTVTVNSLPNVTANASSPEICTGSNVTLFGGGATSYAWSGGVTDNVPFVPASTQTYTVTGTLSGCSNTATVSVIVDAIPNVTANATATTVCAGTSVTLTGGGANSYSWSGGVTNGVPFVPAATSNYTVTGSTPGGCTNLAGLTITVNPLPNVSVNLLPLDTQCVQFTNVNLSGESPAGGTWSGTGVSGSVFNPNAAGTGTWTITYTYSDVNSCSNAASGTIYVDICMDVANALDENEINVYPVPVSGMLTVESAIGNGIPVVSIFNSLGELVYKKQYPPGNLQIDMSTYANGVYSLQLQYGNAIITKKIVKEN